MVVDYISREALRSRVDEIIKTNHLRPDYVWFTPNGVKALALEIPAADVVEVTHAGWVAENSRPKSGLFYCSNCHRTCYDPQPTRAKGWTKRCRYHYCPSCGAKMD